VQVGPADLDHDADCEAVRRAGEAFVAAFEKGDAKAVAVLWMLVRMQQLPEGK